MVERPSNLENLTGIATRWFARNDGFTDLYGFAHAANHAQLGGVLLNANGTHQRSATTDSDNGSSVADLVKGQQRIANFEWLHFVRTDRQDSQANA
ncbi:unannotated protein [freshwater metagenome]|uniref:Unannotated protein n=1 Tax=freshwater metagenome TaxID=449393 RepID=A0A6J6C260_9ZZZZ